MLDYNNSLWVEWFVLVSVIVYMIRQGKYNARSMKKINDEGSAQVSSILKNQMEQMDRIINANIKSMTRIADSMELMAKNIKKNGLNSDVSVATLNAYMLEHIDKKAMYLEELLETNHIHERKALIQKKIREKFIEITQEEISKLSQFVSEKGICLSQPLRDVDLEKFLSEVYAIFFAKEDMKKKLEDFRSLCSGYVNEFRKIFM